MGQDGNEKWKLDQQGTKTLYFSGLAQKSRGAKIFHLFWHEFCFAFVKFYLI